MIQQLHHIVGSLVALFTSPIQGPISYAMQHLSQFVAHPSSAHQQAAYRILRYLKAAPGSGVFFSTSNILQLKAFSDSDWAGCINTKRSITGYLVYLGNSLIS